jgi:CRP/FNR family transcriptional regulator, cyclic AMP receptor protein
MATAPYNLEIIDNCMTCTRRGAGFFCDLAAPSLKSLEEVKYTSSYPSDALLFVEGQAPRGVYILCKGRVKLSMTSADGKSIILHIAGPGELIGLDAAISGAPYGLSAETLEPCQVNFVKREAFMRLMHDQPQISAHATVQFGRDYRAACCQIRSLGLTKTASEKIARFLLDTASNAKQSTEPMRINLSLTHEEIAQIVGVSRETVTRTFTDLKAKSLITVKGPTVVIRDRAGLASLAGL